MRSMKGMPLTNVTHISYDNRCFGVAALPNTKKNPAFRNLTYSTRFLLEEHIKHTRVTKSMVLPFVIKL